MYVKKRLKSLNNKNGCYQKTNKQLSKVVNKTEGNRDNNQRKYF